MSNLLDDNYIEKKKNKLFNYKTVIIWLLLIFTGIVIPLIKLPGSALLILGSSAGLTAYSIFGLTFSKPVRKLNIVVFIQCMLWFIILLYGSIFNKGIPYNILGFITYLSLCFIIFLAYYFWCKVISKL